MSFIFLPVLIRRVFYAFPVLLCVSREKGKLLTRKNSHVLCEYLFFYNCVRESEGRRPPEGYRPAECALLSALRGVRFRRAKPLKPFRVPWIFIKMTSGFLLSIQIALVEVHRAHPKRNP